MYQTRSRLRREDLAIVFISTHGGIGLRYSDRGATLTCPEADFTTFIDTFQVPTAKDGSEVTIYNLSATSTGVCNVVEEKYTNLLARFIQSRSGDVVDPEAFVRELQEFYGPLQRDVIRIDRAEREAESRRVDERSIIATPLERNIVGYQSRCLNHEIFTSGDTMPNKLFVRSDKEIEGVAEGSHDFTIKVLNVSDGDIFDELVFDIGQTRLEDGSIDNIYSTLTSILIDYLVTKLNKKNIVIMDLSCSSFDISPSDREKISQKTQRRIARKLRSQLDADVAARFEIAEHASISRTSKRKNPLSGGKTKKRRHIRHKTVKHKKTLRNKKSKYNNMKKYKTMKKI